MIQQYAKKMGCGHFLADSLKKGVKMEVNQVAILEGKLSRAAKASIFLHGIGITILFLLMKFEPIGYKKMGLVLCILAFGLSLLVGRSYFNAEKELKQCKTASPRSAIRKYNERFLLFFLPYTLWFTCLGVFI